MTGLRVIGGPAACTGFSLAGLPTTEASDAVHGAALLQAFADRSDVGVLLVEQGLLDAMPDAERQELLARPMPVIVPFPAPAWEERAEGAESYVLELLRRAIGYRVRLQ